MNNLRTKSIKVLDNQRIILKCQGYLDHDWFKDSSKNISWLSCWKQYLSDKKFCPRTQSKEKVWNSSVCFSRIVIAKNILGHTYKFVTS